MQFLRTLFWVVLAVLGMVFAFNNWVPVTIHLWSGILLDTRLPVLLFVVFLIGLIPPFVLYRATRWRMRRRLDAVQRAIVPAEPTPATIMPGDIASPTPLP